MTDILRAIVLAVIAALPVAQSQAAEAQGGPRGVGENRQLHYASAAVESGGPSDIPAADAPAISGAATWYDAPTSHDAAAGPALRSALGPHWRGSTVKVCSGGRSCVVVRLTDWCACGHGRVVDLDDQAFRRLAPLSQGVVRVTVSVVGQIDVPSTSKPTPTGPATDVAP